MSTTLYNNSLPLKSSSNHVAKKQVSRQFKWFFTEVGPEMVVSGELNNGWAEGGKGIYEKMSDKGGEGKETLIWATQG